MKKDVIAHVFFRLIYFHKPIAISYFPSSSRIFFKNFSVPFLSLLIEYPSPLVEIFDHVFHVDQEHFVAFV